MGKTLGELAKELRAGIKLTTTGPYMPTALTDEAADRLERIQKCWEEYDAWANGFGYPKPLMLQKVQAAIEGREP